MKRWIWLSVLLVVLGILAAGIFMYFRQNSGPKLLERAHLAYQANDYEKTGKLAQKYIDSNGDKPEGYEWRARAQMGVGNFDQARDGLKEGLQHVPASNQLLQLQAETWAIQARKQLSEPGSFINPTVLADGVAKLHKSNDQLEAMLVSTKTGSAKMSPAEDINVRASLGYGYSLLYRLHAQQSLLAIKDRLRKAVTSQPSTTPDLPSVEAAQQAMEQTQAKTIDALAYVVDQAPQRGEASLTLIQFCGDRLLSNGILISQLEKRQAIQAADTTKQALEKFKAQFAQDLATLQKAQDKILALEPKNQPANAVCALVEVRGRLAQDIQTARKTIQWAMPLMETLLAAQDQADVKLLLAALAQQDRQNDKSLKLADEVLAKEPTNRRARLTKIRALMAMDKLSDAQKELMPMRSREDGEANMMLASVSLELGTRGGLDKDERHRCIGLARECYRAVIDGLETVNPEAMDIQERRMLSQSLLQAYEGSVQAILAGLRSDPKADPKFWYQTAFQDAFACYQRVKGSPEAMDQFQAMKLFVQVAVQSGHQDLARQAAQDALKSDAPVVLVLAAETLRGLGDPDQAALAIQKLLALPKPTEPDSKAAVACGLMTQNMTGEAQRYLSGLTPAQLMTDMQFFTGAALSRSGQYVQAIDYLSSAVKAAPVNLEYRLELATALMGSQLMESAQSEIQKVLAIDPHDARALALQADIRLAQGKDPSEQIQAIEATNKVQGLSLAAVFLRAGQADKCLALCNTQLQDPASNKANVRSLMAQAYLQLKQPAKAVEQWKQLIEAQPTMASSYALLSAQRMREGLAIEQVVAELRAMSKADPMVIRMVTCDMYSRSNRLDEALTMLNDLVADKALTPDQRLVALKIRAGVLMRMGKIDRASKDLNELEQHPNLKKEIMLARAGMLVGAKHPTAPAVLSQLKELLLKDRDYYMLLQVGSMFRVAGQANQALATIDQAIAMAPEDIRGYVLKADLLMRAGKLAEARATLEHAKAAQGDNAQIYVDIAQIQEQQGLIMDAAATLKEMEKLGDSFTISSLVNRADLFARYHMVAQAKECLDKLAASELVGNEPAFRVRLAQMYFRVGATPKALEQLNAIPSTVPQFMPAQLMAVGLNSDSAGQLKALEALAAKYPKDGEVLSAMIGKLLMARQYDKANQVYQAYRKTLDNDQLPLAIPTVGAVQALCGLGDDAKAAALSREMYERTKDAGWLGYAMLLATKENRDWVKSQLPAKDASAGQCVLGVLVADGQESQWLAQLIKKSDPSAELVPQYLLLASVAAGDRTQAKAQLAKINADTGMMLLAARQLMARKDSPEVRQLAKDLLRAMEAGRVRLIVQSWQWGVSILQKDPQCLWAAAVVLANTPDQATLEQMAKAVGDPKTPEAALIRADVASRLKQYKESAEFYAQAAAAMGRPSQLLLLQGQTTEAAGDYAAALAVYQDVLKAKFDPNAANSAAYMVTQLANPTKDQLAQARQWATKATQDQDSAACRDTLGWVCYLQGDLETARQELHTAIRGLANQPEAHYHLAMAELAAGNKDMAKIHLESVVALAQGDPTTMPAGIAQVLVKAKAELAKMK